VPTLASIVPATRLIADPLHHGVGTVALLYANEASTIGNCGSQWLDSSSNADLDRPIKPCVASCRPMMAPHLAPTGVSAAAASRGLLMLVQAATAAAESAVEHLCLGRCSVSRCCGGSLTAYFHERRAAGLR
jgi:hypothetical protein